MLELAKLQAKFEENVLDATNHWTRHVTDADELRGLNEMLIEQARRRAHERDAAGWILSLDQPTYVAVVTDAESPALRRAFYEAWSTRASDQGPNAGRWDNSAGHGGDPGAAARGGAAARFRQLRRVRARDAHGALVEEVLDFLRELAASARSAAQAEFAELEAVRRPRASRPGT